MRCRCCNKILNDHESTARHPVTREPEELCRLCINSSFIQDDPTDPDDELEVWIVRQRLDKYSDSW